MKSNFITVKDQHKKDGVQEIKKHKRYNRIKIAYKKLNSIKTKL